MSEGVTKKGPLIAGFCLFSSRNAEIDPFPGSGKERSGSGTKRVRIRAIPGSKGSGTPPYQALSSPGPLVQGDLDLSNACPGWPWRATGYRAGTAEDTGTEGQLRCPDPCCPEGNRAIEPRGPFLYAGYTGRTGPGGPVLCWVYPGRDGMALAGHQGHYYRGGVHHPALPCSLLFHVAGLACLPVVVTPRLLQAGGGRYSSSSGSCGLRRRKLPQQQYNIILCSVRNR